jgi:tetratricopeptide (TPR) repeat protein
MSPRALKDRAIQLCAKGKFEKAKEIYEQLIPLMPAEPQLRVRYAELCRKTGANDRALQAYADAAELLLQAGMYPRARAALTLAASLDPGHRRVKETLRKLASCEAPTPGPSYGSGPVVRMRSHSVEMAVVNVPMEALSSTSLPGAPSDALPEVKRLSAHAVAYRPGPGAKWLVFSSQTPIHVEERDAVDAPQPEDPFRRLELMAAPDFRS